MKQARDMVLDALDIETFILCKNEEEGRKIALSLMDELGLQDQDIVFLEKRGIGARVRLRGYLHRPGDNYRWMKKRVWQ